MDKIKTKFIILLIKMGSTRYTIKISQEEDKSLYAEVIELP
jgi:hypothetical protein